MKPATFIHREQELADLKRLVRKPEVSLVLVYGRRRVGKSTLLKHWARESGFPTFYWESPRANAESVRANFMRELYWWAGEQGGDGGRVVEARPMSADWNDAFRTLRRIIGSRPTNVILDEFPWAVESDPSLPSRLKTVWDNIFADSQMHLFISGSHISAMEKLLLSDAPLFGRMTGKVLLRPFSLTEIEPFIPNYAPDKRLAVYSIIGGIPDYLRRWDDQADLMTNIREIFLSENSPYRNEHTVLISDVLRRDSPDFETVLSAVGNGAHDLAEICNITLIPSGRVANVLGTLVELRLVERRIRASVPINQHEQARYARYHLADPFLQFYYRFVAPNRSRIVQELYTDLSRIFHEQLRAFVAAEFEQLCRTWALAQAQAGALPFSPEYIGSDWQVRVYQADVLAVNWREHQLLIGEAKWGDDAVTLSVLTDLRERAQKVMQRFSDTAKNLSSQWQTHLILFARHSFTPAVLAEAQQTGVRLVTFAQMMQDLQRLRQARFVK